MIFFQQHIHATEYLSFIADKATNIVHNKQLCCAVFG